MWVNLQRLAAKARPAFPAPIMTTSYVFSAEIVGIGEASAEGVSFNVEANLGSGARA